MSNVATNIRKLAILIGQWYWPSTPANSILAFSPLRATSGSSCSIMRLHLHFEYFGERTENYARSGCKHTINLGTLEFRGNKQFVSGVQLVIFLKNKMDYAKLYLELPKEPVKWTIVDVELWLKFIGLQALYPKFKSLAIDGSCITTLTEEDLRDQLGISSGIIIKKIMSWITKGLAEYNQYIHDREITGNMELEEATQKHKLNLIPNQSIKLPSNKSLIHAPVEPEKENIEHEVQSMIDEASEDGEESKFFELIIQQCDGQASFFSVKQEGARIGRHSTNEILILDEGVSRYHAQIKFEGGKFLLRDIRSTAGTFLKILNRKPIYDQMILEMGSNQFLAHYTNVSLNLQIIEGPAHGSNFQIPRGKVSIGRKSSNLVNFPNDQHLSNIHSTITWIEGNYYVQDMGTTNGTWERLSRESETSEYFQLGDGTIFKVGTNQTYSCKIKISYMNKKCPPNACIICYENVKDCVYMPCKHNTACIKCSKNFKQCPICRVKIEDFIRIYRN